MNSPQFGNDALNIFRIFDKNFPENTEFSIVSRKMTR